MPDGLIVKLSIVPFENAETVQAGPPSGAPFIAQYNPESFSVSTEYKYSPDEPAQGGDGEEAKFKHIVPRKYTFELLLDGTGASPAGIDLDVLAQVALFKTTVGFVGKIHRPTFLLLSWGSFIATCVLETYSVNYKLFRPSGLPLRAVLTATFLEHTAKELGELIKNLSSPDLTHRHEVVAGEHLSLITHRIYEDPRYYIHVAEENKLDTLRSVSKGDSLFFPPLQNTPGDG